MSPPKLPPPTATGTRQAAELLSAPATPVGRERELESLRNVLEAACAGQGRVVLLAGPSGVGKSSLINQLRPLVEQRGGRFVGGKFDQHNEREATAIIEALGVLGRLLLAESADECSFLKSRILRTLGAHAGLARVVPEFAHLLGNTPDPRPVDPAHAAARMVEVVVGLLRATASPLRPLVLVLDDLQWSGALSARLIDAVLAATDVSGLLLVAAYRDDQLAPDHPLALTALRWTTQPNRPQMLHVANLQLSQVARLLAQLLEWPAAPAQRLAQALVPHAHGNPYDTLELVHALRDAGLLAAGKSRAHWDDGAVRQYLAHTPVMDVLAARVARLPDPVRQLLQALACMGTRTSREGARVAASLVRHEFEAAITQLTEMGFVRSEDATVATLVLRHDRVQQAAYVSLPQDQRSRFHLQLARRLASEADLSSLAADQYASAAGEVDDLEERKAAAGLLRHTAAQARVVGSHIAAHRWLSAAVRLLEGAQGGEHDDETALAACEAEYHLALCSIGYLDEADQIYRRIEGRHPRALGLADSACVQVSSLSNRDRMGEAIELGVRVLRDLGLSAPGQFEPASEFSSRFERLRNWVNTFDLSREVARAETTEPWVVAAAKMIYTLLSPAIFKDFNLLAWLIFQSQELWETHGPCSPLVTGLSRAGVVTIVFERDWRTGYLAARHALDLSEARGWEPGVAQVRYVHALIGIHWFEPLERQLYEAERVREELLAGGDLRNASFIYQVSANCLFDCGASLRRYEQELASALALSRRANNRQAIARSLSDQQLLHELLGDGAPQWESDKRIFSKARDLPDRSVHEYVDSYQASARAISCAIFGDRPGLSRHARLAMDLGRSFQSLYTIIWPFWLSGLAAAWDIQAGASLDANSGRDPLVELNARIEWLRQRAIDAPFNFRHMHLHLVAERAWATGDGAAAAYWFDEALGTLEQTTRPWHQALITERAARFHLTQGWAHSGGRLLLEAQRQYHAWGAVAKVARLRSETGGAVPPGSHSPQNAAHHDFAGPELDTRAVLRAAQALNSERSSLRLMARAKEVLRETTGASQVVLAQWDKDTGDWLVDSEDDSGRSVEISIESTPMLVPLTAFRYVERTCEPLLLSDALSDERFARDIYFLGMERCSLMVAPILRRGTVHAMLVLADRSSRALLSPGLLDPVMVIAGQLAVSLESAQLYEKLERKVNEQTRELREAQSRLLGEARQSGMAEIATNVLHNVGNVLTSVSVSTHVLTERVTQSHAARLDNLARLVQSHEGELDKFFGADDGGRMLPAYVRELAQTMQVEREELLAELERLTGSVDHIKKVVAMQQSYAGASGVRETCDITELLDEAIRIKENALQRAQVHVTRDYQACEAAPLDKTRVMQILLNLIDNALQAMHVVPGQRLLTVSVHHDAQWLSVSVRDNGCGIAADDLQHIFAHGFTTKPDGHGFGLHSCALAAREMGGSLAAHSAGVQAGATFALRMPLLAGTAPSSHDAPRLPPE